MNPLYQKLIIVWQCEKFEEEIRQVNPQEETTLRPDSSIRLVDRTVHFARQMFAKRKSLQKLLILAHIQLLPHKSHQR